MKKPINQWQGTAWRGSDAGTVLVSDGLLGGGIRQPLGRRVSVWIEPSLRYGLRRQRDAAALTHIRPYAFGLQAGLSWQLGR